MHACMHASLAVQLHVYSSHKLCVPVWQSLWCNAWCADMQGWTCVRIVVSWLQVEEHCSPGQHFQLILVESKHSAWWYVHRPIPPATSHLLKLFRVPHNSIYFTCFFAFDAVLALISCYKHAVRPGLSMIMTNVVSFYMSMRLASCRCRLMAPASQQEHTAIFAHWYTPVKRVLPLLQSVVLLSTLFLYLVWGIHAVSSSLRTSPTFWVWGHLLSTQSASQAGSVADSHISRDDVQLFWSRFHRYVNRFFCSAMMRINGVVLGRRYNCSSAVHSVLLTSSAIA